jgi:hypothetical protein
MLRITKLMLHRMALRVLPSLSLTVTEESVRKKKRLVMFVPGLVAFGVYRLAKHLLPLSEPVVLLLVSGAVATVTSLMVYRAGRAEPWPTILQQDGTRLLAWLAGWIGFVYGVQLSLLVLALLWLVGYDYLAHPDGPAMMAIIISCTAVARDAFEIGHVRKLSIMGRPFPTFPDGAALRVMIGDRSAQLGPWLIAGLVVGSLGAWPASMIANSHVAVLVQITAITILGGAVGLFAYFGGFRSTTSWMRGFAETKAGELVKYWWWPGLAFTSTYYLVVVGALLFLVKQPTISTVQASVGGSLVTAMMAIYCYYLGYRRSIEEQQGQSLSGAVLRCPFVMGILGKSPSTMMAAPVAPSSKVV